MHMPRANPSAVHAPCRQVQYVGLRRFQLLSVDNESKAYAVAAATWLDDVAPAAPAAAALTDTLELDVFRLLQQVAKYSQQLAAASASNPSSSGAGSSSSSSSPAQPQVLPEAVFMYAPPPPTKQSVAQYLTNAGVPAGQRIATWQRMGSVYDGDTGGKEKPTADPYQVRPCVCLCACGLVCTWVLAGCGGRQRAVPVCVRCKHQATAVHAAAAVCTWPRRGGAGGAGQRRQGAAPGAVQLCSCVGA